MLATFTKLCNKLEAPQKLNRIVNLRFIMIAPHKNIIREVEILLFHFFQDYQKVWRWLLTENGYLEGRIPLDMILDNEGVKLKFWIKNRLKKNLT